MFSGNNRISERQAFRLLTYDLLGLSTLLIPPVVAEKAGRDGIFSIVLGILASLLYLRVLRVIIRDCTTTFPLYLEQCLGKAGGKIVMSGFFLYLLSLAGYVAYLFADVVLESLLREESFYLVLVLLLVLVIYGLWGGLEGRARVYEILFWFLMIPLFLMLFFAMDEIEMDYWSPVYMSDLGDVFSGAYYVFVCMAIIFLILFLGNYVKEKERLFAVGKRAVLFVGGVHAVLYLILVGVFGAAALGGMEYPAVTLMSTVKISGGFLKRTDAFMFAVWFFTLYALLASCIYYSVNALSDLLDRWTGKYSMQKCQSQIAVLNVALAGVIAICFYKKQAWMEAYEWFWWYVATPFVVLVPVFLVLYKYLMKKKYRHQIGKGMAGLALCVLLPSTLTGCATAELEDRNFPIEIAVQDTDEFPQGFLDAHEAGNRMIDYSHLKVIILSQTFIEDEVAMKEFLTLMESRNEIPQSAYLVVAEDAKKVMEMQDALGESVGNYLEQMFENVSQVDKQEFPTLGKLYQEADNKAETLFIPYVTETEDSLSIDQYYVWRRGKAVGTVDSQTAMLSFFTQNRMEEYQLTLQDGVVVSLFDARNEIEFEEKNGTKQVTAQIKCSGEFIGERVTDEAKREEICEQIEEYMNRVAGQVLEQQKVDVTDSFRKLGAMREWYVYYQNHAETYEDDIRLNYEVSIDWVNL